MESLAMISVFFTSEDLRRKNGHWISLRTVERLRGLTARRFTLVLAGDGELRGETSKRSAQSTR